RDRRPGHEVDRRRHARNVPHRCHGRIDPVTSASESNPPARSRRGAFLAPARALMDRLTYPRKFMLISVLFALPLAVVMYLLVSEINDRIEFSYKEMLGNRYLRPLRDLSEHAGESYML